MTSGNATMTSPTGALETGHNGNGYVRITVIKTSSPFKIKNGGVWKDSSAAYVKINNEWKQIIHKYIKKDGVWKE